MGSEAPHRWFPLDVTPLFNQAAVSGVARSTAGNHAGIQLVDRGGMVMHLALLPSAYSKPKPSSCPLPGQGFCLLLLISQAQVPSYGTSVLTWMMRCVKGCVSALRISGACLPGWRLAAPRASPLSLSNAAVALSSGSNTNTVSQLKMPCTAEPLKALQSHRAGWLSEQPLLRPIQTQPGPSALTHLWNSSRSPDCAIETRVLVMEVPTLTPMMIGTDIWTVSTVGVPFQQPCLFANPPTTALGKGRCTHT